MRFVFLVNDFPYSPITDPQQWAIRPWRDDVCRNLSLSISGSAHLDAWRLKEAHVFIDCRKRPYCRRLRPV